MLGRTMRVNNVPVEIVGVAKPGFFGVQIGEWVDFMLRWLRRLRSAPACA